MIQNNLIGFFKQEPRSILGARSVSFVSALCATAVVLFVIMAENPKSINGAAFIFVLSSSVGLPTIFLLGNKNMRRHIVNKAYKNIVGLFVNGKILVTMAITKNKVSPLPDVQKKKVERNVKMQEIRINIYGLNVTFQIRLIDYQTKEKFT